MKITELAKLSTAVLAMGAFSAVGLGCESGSDMDDAGDSMMDAADSTGDAIGDAADDTGDAIDDAMD